MRLFFGEIYNLFVNVAYPFAKDIASYNMAFIFASFASIFTMLVSEVSHLEESFFALKTKDPVG